MDDCIALGADIFLYTRDESRFLRWKESRAKMKLEARKLCRIFNRNVRLYSGCGDTHTHTHTRIANSLSISPHIKSRFLEFINTSSELRLYSRTRDKDKNLFARKL